MKTTSMEASKEDEETEKEVKATSVKLQRKTLEKLKQKV